MPYILDIVDGAVVGTFNNMMEEEKMAIEKEFMTERELENMGIRSAQTLRNDRWSGQNILPFVKIGKSIKYKRKDVLDFLKKNTVPAKK